MADSSWPYSAGQQAIASTSTTADAIDTAPAPVIATSDLFALLILSPLAVLLIRGVGLARAGHEGRAIRMLFAAVAFCGAGIALLLVGAR